MNKATGAIFCCILVTSPLLLLFSSVQPEAPTPLWQKQYENFLDFARRQPQRLLALAGIKQPIIPSIEQVIQETSSAVSAIPEVTIHSAGAAALTIRQCFIEALRNSLQGSKSFYRWTRENLTRNASSGLSEWSSPLSSAPISNLTSIVRDTGNRGLEVLKSGWEWIGPGGRLHPEEFLERFYGHIIIEGLLAVIIGYLFFQSSFKSTSKTPKPLTEEEIDELCDEWQPEPLHTTLPESKLPLKDIVITSATGRRVDIEGISGPVLNMVSFDFLGTAGDPQILENCKATVAKYGVGACGPRGFYGTIDVHIDLEEALAKFMCTAEGIIYSYDLSTVPSVLPAFANAKDLIIVDEAADYPIQNGCLLSRAKIAKFKHNDMGDLEHVIQEELALHKRLRKPLNRRFIVVEGLYKATGDICPLRKVYELKRKYKFRLIVDESLSFGVLGENGRGACEHFDLKPSQVEMVCASMGNALASVGGFCVGDREIVDHQRLSGLGYCFSAALPPYLATAAIGSLAILDSEKGRGLLQKLRRNAKQIREALSKLTDLHVVAAEEDASPVIHVQLPSLAGTDRDEDLQILQRIVDRALQDSNVLFAVQKRSALDKVQAPPSIRLAVTAEHDKDDISEAVSALQSATANVLN